MATDGFKESFQNALTRISKKSSSNCCLIFSGGVDTAAILEANSFLKDDEKVKCSHYITVLVSENASDRPFASLVAKKHEITNQHVVIDIGFKELLQMIPFCIQTLKSFDGMTIRNCIVVALALQKAKDLGAETVVTGDGADELFGGYSFTWKTEDPLWTEKRNQLAMTMYFSTPEMATALGMIAYSPYLEPSFIQWAVENTSKVDCVDDVEIEVTPTSSRLIHTAGKICLRKAYPDSPAAWRRKDPIEVGSGSSQLPDYFNQLITQGEFEEKKKLIQENDKVMIRNKEHLYYYQEFQKIFPDGLSSEQHNQVRFGSDPCIACGYQLKNQQEMFCHVCGAWPARTSS